MRTSSARRVTCDAIRIFAQFFLDGTYYQDGAALAWQELGHRRTREVGEVLEQAVRRMARYLERRASLEAAGTVGADARHEVHEGTDDVALIHAQTTFNPAPSRVGAPIRKRGAAQPSPLFAEPFGLSFVGLAPLCRRLKVLQRCYCLGVYPKYCATFGGQKAGELDGTEVAVFR
jgi:hypothetical protein